MTWKPSTELVMETLYGTGDPLRQSAHGVSKTFAEKTSMKCLLNALWKIPLRMTPYHLLRERSG